MVVQQNEFIMLLLGAGVLLFVLFNHARLRRVPSWGILFSGILLLLLAWVFTVLETFHYPELCNFLEHACDAGSAALIALWCWMVFSQRKAPQ